MQKPYSSEGLVPWSQLANSRMARFLLISVLGLSVSACAQSALTRSGSLVSYEGLQRSDGILTQTNFRVDKDRVLPAKSVAILPAVISEGARSSGLNQAQLQLVSNNIDRALCAGLSERFQIAAPLQPADLTVQAFVTAVSPTNVAAASVSSIASIGGSVAGAAIGVPIRVPRIPIGLGGLSVEAQAIAGDRRQVAAMTWARGADVVTTRPRASEEADAYALAVEFGSDFARLMVTGNDPIKNLAPLLPSAQSVGEFFGSEPKEAACARFGPNPGVNGLIGTFVGLPPNSTDSGASQ